MSQRSYRSDNGKEREEERRRENKGEGATKVICVDSAYCNLIEQLNMGGDDKVLFLRSDIQYTPVLKNGWQFAWLKKPDRVLDQRVYNLAEMERNGAKPKQTVGYVSR